MRFSAPKFGCNRTPELFDTLTSHNAYYITQAARLVNYTATPAQHNIVHYAKLVIG